MASFRCPSCNAKNPVEKDDTLASSKSVHIPAADQCAKCGADLREPGLEELDGLPFMGEMSIEELLALDNFERNARMKGLELRARLHDRLGRPDEALQDRRQAVKEKTADIDSRVRSGDTQYLSGALLWRASMHERAGEQTEGARDRLLAADMIAARAGETGAKAAVVAAPVTVAIGGIGFGGEMADAARAGAQHTDLKTAQKIREKLLSEGRAVGVGVCRKCGDVGVTADGRCPKRHKVKDRRYVLPEDAAAALAELHEADAASTRAANWYPDPQKRHDHRYWDGARWTDQVSDAGVQSVDPVGASPARAA